MGAARRKGKWCGGSPVFGYDLVDRKMIVNELEAEQVREIFKLYLELKSVQQVLNEVDERGWRTKAWTTKSGKPKMWNTIHQEHAALPAAECCVYRQGNI